MAETAHHSTLDADATLRRRRPADKNTSAEERLFSSESYNKSHLPDVSRNFEDKESLKSSYWLTRIWLLRFIGFLYFVAFAVAFHQNEALIGTRGLLPYNVYLKKLLRGVYGGSRFQLFSHHPTIMLFVPDKYGDFALNLLSAFGLLLSAAVMLTGAANVFAMTLLWAMYHSVVNVGQRWYSFGWESQLLESGFLAIFLCPLFKWRKLPEKTWSSFIVMLLFRWMLFRIMLGAGLIKLRGDQCWRDLTCTEYHYETQPVPNPLSYFMHQAPLNWHKFEILANHFSELIAPFMLLVPMPRLVRTIGGLIQLQFQLAIIASGNFAFLNWLTILPCLACFDDYTLAMFHRRSTVAEVVRLNKLRVSGWNRARFSDRSATVGQNVRVLANIGLLALISYLSLPVVVNLVSRNQIMNTSFEPLRLVNTYGAFGSITKKRTELIFEGTSSTNLSDANIQWLEYEFKCKPGNVARRPCLISPYHYRLDWLMWFAAMQPAEYNPWLFSLVGHLLENDVQTSSLIQINPFSNITTGATSAAAPPKWIRVRQYLYKWTVMGSAEAKSGKWWNRKLLGEYIRPLSKKEIVPLMAQMRRDDSLDD